ncbi:MAG TPA: hypothetical protein V6D05_14475, partial [Stenomitos sp.]
MQDARRESGPPAWERLVKVTLGLLLSMGFINWIYDHLPRLRPSGTSGIVSVIQLAGLDSRQNYLVFGACVGVVTIAAWACGALIPRWSARAEAPAPGKARRLPSSSLGLQLQYWLTEAEPALTRLKQRFLGLRVHPLVLAGVGGMLFLSWLINAEYRDLGMVLTHSKAFHEGEFLGFGATLAQGGGPFTSAFFIHGFGINALPDLLAQHWGFRSNGIAAARMFRVLESTAAWLGAAWVIFEIVRTYRSRAQARLGFLVTLFAFLLVSGLLYELTLRRALSLPQLAALIWFLRTGAAREPRGWRDLLAAFALGCSVPLAFLYDYSEAMWFAVILVVCSPLAFLQEGRAAWRWLSSTGVGLLAGSLALWLGLGPVQGGAMLGQILYWGHYGRDTWFVPLTASTLHASTTFGLLVLAPSLTVAYLLTSYRRHPGLRDAVRRYGVIGALLIGTLLGDRVGLDRAIEEHLRWSAVNTCLLMAALGWSMYSEVVDDWRDSVLALLPRAVAAILGGALVLVAGPRNADQLSPFRALEHVQAYAGSFWTPDTTVLAGPYAEARAALGPEMAQSDSFYTLNSDAVWYRVFQKPAASRFHQLTYARAPEGQAEVIRSLEQKRPTFILASGYGSMNGISIEVGNPAVYRYVLEHYRPYKQIDRYGFWKRLPEAGWRRAGAPGIPGAVTDCTRISPVENRVSGYVELPVSQLGSDGVWLYLATKKGTLVSLEPLDPSKWDR